MGGLGSAVAEALAEAGSATPLRRIGICDVFGESGSREYLFTRYGLNTQHIVDTVWRALAINRPVPTVAAIDSVPGEYAPV
jgi:transketolase